MRGINEGKQPNPVKTAIGGAVAKMRADDDMLKVRHLGGRGMRFALAGESDGGRRA